MRLAPGSTKNREGRTFPFTTLPQLEALLRAQREHTCTIERATGTIVTNVFHRNGQPIRDMRGAWDATCERAGLPELLFHDLRRSAVRRLERAGVPRAVAMKLTGHKTESVYRLYAIADAASLSEGVEKLARLDRERFCRPKRHAHRRSSSFFFFGYGRNTAENTQRRPKT